MDPIRPSLFLYQDPPSHVGQQQQIVVRLELGMLDMQPLSANRHKARPFQVLCSKEVNFTCITANAFLDLSWGMVKDHGSIHNYPYPCRTLKVLQSKQRWRNNSLESMGFYCLTPGLSFFPSYHRMILETRQP